MEMPVVATFRSWWLLMETHGIRERRLEQIVITDSHLAKYLCKLSPFQFRQFAQPSHVPPS